MPETTNLYSTIISRFNDMMAEYGSLAGDRIYQSFMNASASIANQPSLQNKRVKSIPALPVDYTKEDIGTFLQNPYSSERQLQETAEILRWTNYPFYKIIKTYQDINTCRYFSYPVFDDVTDDKTFKREMRLIDKISKQIAPTQTAHEIIGSTLISGKAFYYLRKEIDKAHNQVKTCFLQRLPQAWCTIIGFNNISKYTISFNLMYFMQPGTSPSQFGNLFDPYLDDFYGAFEEVQNKPVKRAKYSSYKNIDGKNMQFNPQRVKANASGNPRVFKQDGRWCYYVSLPIEDVWTFEIDDTTPAVISPLAGLMLTYAQQSDFEQAQLSNVISPLLMFLTAEIPYFENSGTMKEDDYRLSLGGRELFNIFFQEMLSATNTGGIGFFSAPVKNFKAHTFPESANANEIAQKYSIYSTGKSGLGALIPVDEDVKASQVQSSQMLESRYACCVYRQFENMMNYLYESLNLEYEWRFVMFGSCYLDENMRESAMKALAIGDTSALYVIAALDGTSLNDKHSMVRSVNKTGIMDDFRIPETAYTQSGKQGVGRPTSEGITSDGKEKAIDAGYTE